MAKATNSDPFLNLTKRQRLLLTPLAFPVAWALVGGLAYLGLTAAFEALHVGPVICLSVIPANIAAILGLVVVWDGPDQSGGHGGAG